MKSSLKFIEGILLMTMLGVGCKKESGTSPRAEHLSRSNEGVKLSEKGNYVGNRVVVFPTNGKGDCLPLQRMLNYAWAFGIKGPMIWLILFKFRFMIVDFY